MSLGSQVKKYRDAAGLSYPELAEISGVDVGNINALEKRNSRRSEHGPALARALGLSFEQLIDTDTDHSDLVRVHQAQRKALASPPAYIVSENVAQWRSGYWPFANISPERFRAVLDPDDIDRIETYIRAILDTREGERLKNAG